MATGGTGCPGCRDEVVLQIAFGVVDRWLHPPDGTTPGIPPRHAWNDALDASVAIALTDLLVGASSPRAANMVDTIAKRYRDCVSELLSRLVEQHEGSASAP
jgi:hypothetical protein